MFYVVTTLSLRWIPVAASSGPSSIAIWLIGLFTIFIPLALCVMELSSRYPQEGGMYVWIKRAFGDGPAFVTGWIYWTSNLPYFPAVLYFAASNALYVGGTRWNALQHSPLYFTVFSIFGVALALALNIVGLNIGKWLSNLGALGVWIPVSLLCVVAIIAFAKFGSATSFTASAMHPSLNIGTLGVWATILYAFSGSEAASFMGDEIKDARRTIPRALIVAGALITGGYILGTVAILVALPHSAGQQHGRHHAGHYQRRRTRRLERHRPSSRAAHLPRQPRRRGRLPRGSGAHSVRRRYRPLPACRPLDACIPSGERRRFR